MSLILPTVSGGPGEIEVSFGLIAPFPNFLSGLARAAVNILLVGLPTLFFIQKLPRAA